MNVIILERAGAVLAAVFGARAYAQWRVARREREALTTSLVDPVLLETVFAARIVEGDDADLLAELRDTFLHLNRRAYAEEFWGLHTQVAALFGGLEKPKQAAMRRAIMRLIASRDRWLQLVGAKSASELGMAEAIPELRALLVPESSQSANAGEQEDAANDAADQRFRQEIEQALATLADFASHGEKLIP